MPRKLFVKTEKEINWSSEDIKATIPILPPPALKHLKEGVEVGAGGVGRRRASCGSAPFVTIYSFTDDKLSSVYFCVSFWRLTFSEDERELQHFISCTVHVGSATRISYIPDRVALRSNKHEHLS